MGFFGGKEVAKGNHVVPAGVAVEELDGGKKKLADECPPDLRTLLEKRDLVVVYDKFVAAVVEESHTRSMFGNWKDQEFNSVLNLFRDEFAEGGIKVALCKRKSGSGTFRWLEFIDTEIAEDYVPQFDVSNLSGQVIKTCYTTLEFPFGVAVEELSQWRGRKKLKDKIPIYVEKMLTEKDLMNEYDQIVEAMIEKGVGPRGGWKNENLLEVIDFFRPMFEAKGITLFAGYKQEYVSHGQYGGHNEYFRWIEFVDREQQPNYFPQRDAETRKNKDDCVIC